VWRDNFIAMKRWFDDLFTVPYDIEELELIAKMWTLSDPTISEYTFDNGVEDRHATSPYRRIEETVNSLEELVAVAQQQKADAFKQAQ
jgi:hypothetical protein